MSAGGPADFLAMRGNIDIDIYTYRNIDIGIYGKF